MKIFSYNVNNSGRVCVIDILCIDTYQNYTSNIFYYSFYQTNY